MNKCNMTFLSIAWPTTFKQLHRSLNSPVHISHKLLQLACGGAGLKVLDSGLPIGTDVHVQLVLIALRVHHARLAGQYKGTQPQRVHLKNTTQVQILLGMPLHVPTQPKVKENIH